MPRIILPSNSKLPFSREQICELVEAVRSGDVAAFEQLYRATSAKLYGIVVRLVGRRDLADDVLQEAYLRIWKHAARFDLTRGSPITWMVAIARNCALDEIRRNKYCAVCSSQLLEACFDSEVGDDHTRTEDASSLYACLSLLGPEMRELIVQAYCFGISRRDLAKRMDRPVSTIKTWLRRSLAELKSHIDEARTESDDVGNVGVAGHPPWAPERQRPSRSKAV